MTIFKNKKLWIVLGALITAAGTAYASGADYLGILKAVLSAVGVSV